MSIAACWNVYRDAKALRGSLELASSYFDNLFVILTPPGGEANKDDETCDLLREFGIDPKFGDINEGFGVIRSRLIHECGCDWAFLMDADERFYPSQFQLRCEGDERYPGIRHPALTVRTSKELICPGNHLRELMKLPDIDAIKTIRRHWLTFDMKHPAQNWEQHPDWQLRIVRNVAEIGYERSRRMHERIIDKRRNGEPRSFQASVPGGPFHDHFHCHFRHAHPGTKERNEAEYQKLERGEPMLA